MIEKPETSFLDAFAIARAFGEGGIGGGAEVAVRLMNECSEEYEDPGHLAVGFSTIIWTLASLLAGKVGGTPDDMLDLAYRGLIKSIESDRDN